MPHRASQVVLVVSTPSAHAGDTRDTGLTPGLGRSPGGGVATHFSILARKIPWTEEPGRPLSVGSQRVGHEHDWTSTHLTLGGLATNARREEDSEVASALPACCPSSAFLWPREWNKQNAVLRILPWGRNWEIFESNTLAFKWRNIHLKETVRSVLCSHFSTWKCKPPRRSEGWNSQKKETCSTGNPKRRNGLVN